MKRSIRLVALSGAAAGLAGLLFVVGAAFGSTPDAPRTDAGQSEGPAPRATGLAALQADTERVPLDPSRWSGLGLAYVTQARLTADPSWYAKADEALTRSLQLEPDGNAAALTGQAALAAGRHQFSQALALTTKALALNGFSPVTYGVRVDALTELGRYDDALRAAERMLDLGPGVDSYSRLSYAYELRGDRAKARLALDEAGRLATTPADEAFVQFYLGELAFNSGDLDGAAARYESALVADADYLAARAGRAKVEVARGDVEAGLADYAAVVARLPQPSYLAEYGEALERAGRPQEAQEQYEVVRVLQKAFADQGSDVDSELALFEADHGDRATALRLAERAHRDRPLTISVQDAYAWALHVNGRDAEALPFARQAVRLGTPNALAYAHLGTIEAALGDTASARTHLRRALALNPHFNPLQAPRAAALLRTLS